MNQLNSSIESLNHWGGNFLSFAWPMFWQSSVLIVVLLAFDFLFRRKLRASLRYTLWLVVLVKLCLPTTLASPTSPAWWLWRKPSPPVVIQPATHYTVTYDNTPLPDIPQTPLPAFVPPTPALTLAAWLLMVSVSISGLLLCWLLVRWWQITLQVRRAASSERLARLTDAAQKIVGMKFKVRVKLTANSMSPAVCGLFRPAILIPQSLADNFSDGQLRAVLLHELIHLRRRDVWLNFAQALLQIFYWWHPLLWFANARIRRVREEAVDDAVMLALRDDAEAYAPTLLEVAKLALNRPLASLGLVGIMESRHALRQRIERLVDFRPPRRAGLTLVSLLGILAFTAVAVPMGEGPASAEKQTLPAPVVSAPSTVTLTTNVPSVLVSVQFYWIWGEDFKNLFWGFQFNPGRKDKDSYFSASPDVFSNSIAKLKSSGLKPISAPRIQTGSGMAAEVYFGNGTNGVWFNCTPVVNGDLVNLAANGKVIDGDIPEIATNQFNTSASVENSGGIVVLAKSREGMLTASNLVAVISVQTVTTNDQIQASPKPIPASPTATQTVGEKPSASLLVQDGKLLYEMGKLDEAEKKFKAALALDPENAAAKYYLKLLRPRTNDLLPTPNARAQTNLIYTGASRQVIESKLDRIRMDAFFDNVPLSEVIQRLSEQAKLRDPDKKGINFMLNNNNGAAAPTPLGAPGAVDPATGLPLAPPAAGGGQVMDIGQAVINLNPGLVDVRLVDVLDAIVQVSDKEHPIKYTVMDYAIVFLPKGPDVPQLYTRTFKVDPNTFYQGLQSVMTFSSGTANTNGGNGGGLHPVTSPDAMEGVSVAARTFFRNLGVDLTAPGKSIFYGDRLGELFVRATDQDLDTIERAVQMLNQTAPQLHIKARFLELPIGTMANFGSFLKKTNSTADMFTGILTDADARTVLHSLESRKGFEQLAEPEAVTTSGRQTQMRATDVITVITNFAFMESLTNGAGSIVPQTRTVEIGPILDVVPYVLADGYTINLTVIPSLTEFLGYDQPPDTQLPKNDPRVQMPVALPRFSVRQVVTTLNLWDNQTVVVGVLKKYLTVNGNAVVGKSDNDKEIVVFITATIIDPAGNRVHSDVELPFAKTGVPPQPAQPKTQPK